MRCITIDDDSVTRRLLAEYIARTDFLIDAGQFEDSISAINFLQASNEVDLIFLDVRMPGMDGFEFLDTLEGSPQVIVMSVSDEYALRAFDFGASDYLLKPISYARFYKGVSKALKWMKSDGPDGELYLKKNQALIRVPYNQIVWIESMENYVNIYTEKERFTLHFMLKTIEGHMPPSMFRRVHRSYIVNLTKIESIEDSTVLLRNGEEVVSLPIGKAYRKNLLSSLRFLAG